MFWVRVVLTQEFSLKHNNSKSTNHDFDQNQINSADGYESKPNLDEEIVTYETKFKAEGVQCVLHLLLATRKT